MQCSHIPINISSTSFHISITSILEYLNFIHYLLHNNSTPSHNLLSLFLIAYYINPSNNYLNTITINLSNHSNSITTTKQDNRYTEFQISLYENNRVWKAPDSLFCIKIPFKDNIYIYIYRGWEGILQNP